MTNIKCPGCGVVSQQWEISNTTGAGTIDFNKNPPEVDYTVSHLEMYCPNCLYCKEGSTYELSEWVKWVETLNGE